MTITLAQLNLAAAEVAKLAPAGQVLVQLRDGTRVPFAAQGGQWHTIHVDVAVDGGSKQPQEDRHG